MCHAAGLSAFSLEIGSRLHLSSLAPPRCQLQARQAPRGGLRLHQRGHQLQLGLRRGQLLCLLSQGAALRSKALHCGTRLPHLAPLCMSSRRLSGRWTKLDTHSPALLRQGSLLWESTPDGGPSGVSGPALDEQQVSSVAVRMQHGKHNVARLSHSLATGTLHHVAWLWHGSTPSRTISEWAAGQWERRGSTSRHCTLHHQQATSVGRQAVQGPAAPLERTPQPPSDHAGSAKQTICGYSLQHQQAPSIDGHCRGLPDLACSARVVARISHWAGNAQQVMVGPALPGQQVKAMAALAVDGGHPCS